MSVRYTSFVDLHVILRRGHRVLLGRRRNTGYGDGEYALPAGHLEKGEAATEGAAREAAEETCVTIDPSHLVLRHVMHHRTTSGRVGLFFEATAWTGEIANGEPDLCEGWEWHELDELPSPIVPYIAEALRHIRGGVLFSERGWDA